MQLDQMHLRFSEETVRRMALAERCGEAHDDLAADPFWDAVATAMGYALLGFTWHVSATLRRPGNSLLQITTEDGLAILRLAGRLDP